MTHFFLKDISDDFRITFPFLSHRNLALRSDDVQVNFNFFPSATFLFFFLSSLVKSVSKIKRKNEASFTKLYKVNPMKICKN